MAMQPNHGQSFEGNPSVLFSLPGSTFFKVLVLNVQCNRVKTQQLPFRIVRDGELTRVVAANVHVSCAAGYWRVGIAGRCVTLAASICRRPLACHGRNGANLNDKAALEMRHISKVMSHVIIATSSHLTRTSHLAPPLMP
jgi:hypothetical protein